MTWIDRHTNKEINTARSDCTGFVYRIIHKSTGKYYIGQKHFWNKRTLPPLKGKKNKRHKLVESDWKTYWGSSNKLLKDIEKYGQFAFKREILCYCKRKWDLSYMELAIQMDNSVLLDPKSYNEIVNVRLRKAK